MEYDDYGRRVAIDNPDTGKTQWWYDDAGNMIAKQTANLRKKNQYIRYSYRYHQLIKVDNPEGDDVVYTYGNPGDGKNGAGRVVQEAAGKLIDSYSYDGLGQVIQKKRSIEGKTYSITYRWDNFGRQRSVAYSNGFSVYYSYDTGGQVKAVTGFFGATVVPYVKTVHYDQYGSRTFVEYGNGVVTTYTYDEAMHRLVQLQTKQGDSTYQNIRYTYDKVGNILTRTENGILMSNSNPKTITHRYTYDTLYRLTEAEGSIKEEGNTVHSYTNSFAYSPIGNILRKVQNVKANGSVNAALTYDYTYGYNSTKPHAVTNINDNLTYRYDANGNMTAVYDTAKNYSRILQWDEDNRLTKTVDTTAGESVATSYAYDVKGMRILKEGPYGKTIYVDTGYVETNANIVSNHVFMGNTRVASIVKHKDEQQPATYYYASDHLGSSSVLTNNTGNYHERIEYLPYGEVWLEDASINSTYSTPYKFTGKELDKETGLYYFGARFYEARISRWISTDPALEKYFPKPNDYDTEHDFYWYILNDSSGKLPGMGGVFNSHNLDMYCYSLNNPVKYYDPDGNVTKLNIGEESVVRLIKAGAKVIEDPEYRRGAGGHMNNTNQNATWCNQAAFDIIENTGLDITKFTLRGGRNQTRANDAFVKMLGESIKGNLKMVDAKTAQELANKGYTVVAGAMGRRVNNDGSLESGHVAVVAPSDISKFDGNEGPMVYHVGGGTNKVMSAKEAFRDLFEDVKYFYDPKQKIK